MQTKLMTDNTDPDAMMESRPMHDTGCNHHRHAGRVILGDHIILLPQLQQRARHVEGNEVPALTLTSSHTFIPVAFETLSPINTKGI